MLKFSSWILFILFICGLSLWRFLPSEVKQIGVKTSTAELKVIEQVVIENGIIGAKEKSVIQTYISGSIIEMVASGTYVKKGAVVARIDNSNYEDNILEYDIDLMAEKLTLEISKKMFDLIDFEEGTEVIERQEDLRHAKLSYDEEVSKPTKEELRRLEIALKLAALDLEEATANLVRQKNLYTKGFLSKVSLEPHERRLATKKEKVQEANLNISVAKKGIPEERKVELEQNLMRAKASLERREKRKQRRLDEQTDIIKVSQQKIAEMEFKQKNLVEKSKNSVCYADKEGYAIVRTYWDWYTGGKFSAYAPGGQVRERDAIIEIVTPGKMVANVIFNESDFHRLKAGLSVEISLPAFPGKVFQGNLSALGAIGKDRNDWMEELSGRSGVSMYNGTVTFDNGLDLFQPGMSVNLKIRLKKSYQALVVPRSAINTVEDKFWVYSQGKKIEVQGKNVNEFDFQVNSGLEQGGKVLTFFPKDNS